MSQEVSGISTERLAAAQPATRARRQRRRLGLRPWTVLRFLCLFAGGLLFASVFVYAVLSAVKPPDEVLAMKWWPSEWRWSNFTLPFKQTAF